MIIKKLKIAVITQSDIYSIPQNVFALCDSKYIDVKCIIQIDSKGSLSNKKFFFLSGFGFFQCFLLFLKGLRKRIIILFEKISFYNFNKCSSLFSISKYFNCDYKLVNGIHNRQFISTLKEYDLDLIVSFSAPIVFKPIILDIPRKGCINLHCSLLPNYAGLFPSFWTLFEGSNDFGVSVHFMDNQIDNGDVIAQKKIFPQYNASIFDIILETKRVGGQLVLKVVNDIATGKKLQVLNLQKPVFHYSWPTIKQMKDFRKRGGRLA